MNNVISWIAAVAEHGEGQGGAGLPSVSSRRGERSRALMRKFSIQHLPQHQFPPTTNIVDSRTEQTKALEDDPLDRNPELRSYRGRTVELLRRYLKFSMETGRLPSVLGCSFFRTGATSYSVVTFEDRVVFAHDMELCLERLQEFSRQIIARYVMQEHSVQDTAQLLRCNEKTVRRMIPLALDQLSEILLEVGLMEALDFDRQNSCQEAKNDEFPASDWE